MVKFIKISTFLISLIITSAPPVAHAEILYRNLWLGKIGEDVKILQQILNRDDDTLVATLGPGSKGKESTYFGYNTLRAVIKFQEKYSSEVLSPAGLTSGTGFVGILTRNKVNSLLGIVTNPNPRVFTTTTATITTTTSVPGTNPNAENLDIFLLEVIKIQVQNGKSMENAESLAKTMRQIALSTSTNFRTKFITDLNRGSVSATNYLKPPSFINKLLKKAYAQTGIQFGGRLTYAFPCGCSATTLVTIASPSASTGVYDYVYGTQAYSSYNAPYASWFLGMYIPGQGVSCYVPIGTGCALVSSKGMITSMLGTSAY